MKAIFVLLCICMSAVCATNYPVKVGNTLVVIKHYQQGKGKTFVHLHQNETTAKRAALAVMKAQGGSLLTLKHPGGRTIVFYLAHKRYEFDPNRIFSHRGIKKTLLRYSRYSPEAHAQVKKLADKIKKLLPKGKVIAVHNNRSYSMKNYLPGKGLAKDAHRLHYNKHKNYRNFYLVTRRRDFIRLKRLQYNSVLQRSRATDDGSLSIYLSKRQYINVEAGYHQLNTQINMLKHA